MPASCQANNRVVLRLPMTLIHHASWGVSGQRDYSPDTKRACAELNACVRRAKNNSAGRAAAAPAPGSSSLKSSPKGSTTDSVARTAPDAGGGGKFRATCGEDAKRV